MNEDAVTQLLSIPTVAKSLACSRGHVYHLINNGQIRVVEIKAASSTRTKTRIRREDLQSFIDCNTGVQGEKVTTLAEVSGFKSVAS